MSLGSALSSTNHCAEIMILKKIQDNKRSKLSSNAVDKFLTRSLNDKSQLEEIINQDQFHIHGIADYEFIEFTPVKYHQAFSNFIDNKC